MAYSLVPEPALHLLWLRRYGRFNSGMTWRFNSRKRELNTDFRLKIASSVNSPRDAPRPKIALQTVEPGLEGRLLAQLTSESGRLC